MLSEFLVEHRAEIIARCRSRVAGRTAPRPTTAELEEGIPLFLEHLAVALREKLTRSSAPGEAAAKHGGELLRHGFTVAQVVQDYGNTCQAITQLAIERGAAITTEEFRLLNLSLDEAIADAVTEYGRQHDLGIKAEDEARAVEDLGVFAHELRNHLATAMLAFDTLRSGAVGISGSTGEVLGRSLISLRELIDSSLAAVRMKAGLGTRDRIVMSELLEEVEISAMMHAKVRGLALAFEVHQGSAIVEGDRQILAAVLANLIQNALKYTHPKTQVVVRASATDEHVRIEVEDECGGLPPGKAATLFEPFQRGGTDRSGLGLGLAICSRGVAGAGGTIGVRDVRKGCVFFVELPRASA